MECQGFAFTGRSSRTHARFNAKWGQRPAWVGVHPSISGKPMGDGRDIYTYVFEALREFQANAIPAVSLDASEPMAACVAAIAAVDGLGSAIAVRLEDLMKPDARTRIEALVSSLGLSLAEVDLVIDLGAPNFEPYSTFAGALIAAVQTLGDLHPFRNFVAISTVIPQTFKDVAKGADRLPRHDWLFYQALLDKMPASMRLPNYGDYTIVHPEFAPVDMRKIKSAASSFIRQRPSGKCARAGRFATIRGRCTITAPRSWRQASSAGRGFQSAMTTSPNARRGWLSPAISPGGSS